MAEILRNEYLICYDIENTKSRTKVFKELEKSGMRSVQKSVFWGYLTKAELSSICRFIDGITGKEDRTLITRTNISGHGFSHLVGYSKEEFHDWEENYVI
jgi:CRISPR-associated endonuclease Cas2